MQPPHIDHGHVLLTLEADGEIDAREVAARLDIDERLAESLLGDLVMAGMVDRDRVDA